MRPRPALLLALLVLVLLGREDAEARCRSSRDLERLGASVREELECRAAALRGPPRGSCGSTSVASCAREARDEMVRLVLGDPDSLPTGAEAGASRCQAAVARFAAVFVERRLGERATGQRRARSAKALRRVPSWCEGASVWEREGERLPRLGGACASVIGGPGSPVDGERILRCLRPRLERAIDDVAPEPLRPNVVLVLTDDQRWDTLFYQPAVASLARDGIVFRNAFATTPVCSPSRASILSGRYAHHHGVTANGLESRMDPTRTIATWLAGAGYATGFFGKYLNDASRLGLAPPPGWSDWRIFLDPSGGSYFGFALFENGVLRPYGPDVYSTDVLAEHVTSFIRSNASRPFFAVFAPFAPHAPADPAARHRGSFAALPPWRPPSWHADDVDQKPIWVQFMRAIMREPGTWLRDVLRIRELESLRAVDDGVGRITELLERAGIADHTVVIYTSDHGIHWGEHWLGNKFSAYEESIRVPYVMRYPLRAPIGGTRDELVLNLDIAPTLAELAGARAPRGLDGASLVPLLGEAGFPWRSDFLIESPGELIAPPSEAVRTERWKYIETSARKGVTRELYDLAADPYERENLASHDEHADTRRALERRLEALHR